MGKHLGIHDQTKSIKGSPIGGKNLIENKCIRILSQKRDLKIQGHRIEILVNDSSRKSYDLGNKSWGKIDFLEMYCGYTIEKVNKFSNQY